VQLFPARADIVMPAGVAGPDPVSSDVHAFVVRDGDDVILVDTLLQSGHVDLIADALARAGSGFESIRYIVLTHHHPDHTGGLAEVVSRAPQAQVLGGAGDARVVTETTGVAVDVVGAGDSVLGLEVVPTPGHTAGHVCLVHPGTSTILLGDVVGNIGDLERGPAQFTENADQAEATLHELAERGLEHGVPSHGDPFAAASRSIGELLRKPA
jgi:glyoxylase-like metal-dependent hydrolase (beta-lactamase superfamily II)